MLSQFWKDFLVNRRNFSGCCLAWGSCAELCVSECVKCVFFWIYSVFSLIHQRTSLSCSAHIHGPSPSLLVVNIYWHLYQTHGFIHYMLNISTRSTFSTVLVFLGDGDGAATSFWFPAVLTILKRLPAFSRRIFSGCCPAWGNCAEVCVSECVKRVFFLDL